MPQYPVCPFYCSSILSFMDFSTISPKPLSWSVLCMAVPCNLCPQYSVCAPPPPDIPFCPFVCIVHVLGTASRKAPHWTGGRVTPPPPTSAKGGSLHSTCSFKSSRLPGAAAPPEAEMLFTPSAVFSRRPCPEPSIFCSPSPKEAPFNFVFDAA